MACRVAAALLGRSRSDARSGAGGPSASGETRVFRRVLPRHGASGVRRGRFPAQVAVKSAVKREPTPERRRLRGRFSRSDWLVELGRRNQEPSRRQSRSCRARKNTQGRCFFGPVSRTRLRQTRYSRCSSGRTACQRRGPASKWSRRQGHRTATTTSARLGAEDLSGDCCPVP